MKLFERIRSRREELGLSQTELARKLGYQSRSSINKIEQGINDIPQSKIVEFAKVLKCPPAYLMGWEDYPFQLKELAEKETEKRKLMKIVESLNIRLKQAIEIKNIGLFELSQKTGISERVLNSYLSGRTHPNWDNIYSISRILEVSHDWLTGYDVPMEAKYYSKDYKLSAEEECIVTIFRNMNKSGQDRLLEYSMELIEIPKYKLKDKNNK